MCKIMKCYFCQEDLNLTSQGIDYDHFKCMKCSNQCQGEVYTSFNHRIRETAFAHIYIPISDKDKDGEMITYYHIRLCISENYTEIEEDYKKLFNLPGLTLNPNNVRQKFPLYMLFS
jgi:hypothetical protein